MRLILEAILTFSYTVGQRDDTIDGRFTVQAANEIGQIVEDGKIVLDDDDIDVWR